SVQHAGRAPTTNTPAEAARPKRLLLQQLFDETADLAVPPGRRASVHQPGRLYLSSLALSPSAAAKPSDWLVEVQAADNACSDTHQLCDAPATSNRLPRYMRSIQQQDNRALFEIADAAADVANSAHEADFGHRISLARAREHVSTSLGDLVFLPGVVD